MARRCGGTERPPGRMGGVRGARARRAGHCGRGSASAAAAGGCCFRCDADARRHRQERVENGRVVRAEDAVAVIHRSIGATRPGWHTDPSQPLATLPCYMGGHCAEHPLPQPHREHPAHPPAPPHRRLGVSRRRHTQGWGTELPCRSAGILIPRALLCSALLAPGGLSRSSSCWCRRLESGISAAVLFTHHSPWLQRCTACRAPSRTAG